MILRIFDPQDGAQFVTSGIDGLLDDYAATHPIRPRTLAEYRTTANVFARWLESPVSYAPRCRKPSALGLDPSDLDAAQIADFLQFCFDEAVTAGGLNPQGTANKHRRHLQTLLTAALGPARPTFPPPRKARRVSGRHHFNDAELAALVEAAGRMVDPPRWRHPTSLADNWTAAIVLGATYGLDSGLLFPRTAGATRLLAGNILHVEADPYETETPLPYGAISYDRPKTGRPFLQPLTALTRMVTDRVRQADPEAPLLVGGSNNPAARFRTLVADARLPDGRPIHDKIDRDRGHRPWVFQDLRKTAATRIRHQFGVDAARAVLGHAPAGVTDRHYADDLPLLVKVFLGPEPLPDFYKVIPHENQ